MSEARTDRKDLSYEGAGEELAEVRRKRIEAMFPHFRFRRRAAARASAPDDSAG